ncbi:MAG: type IV pilin-like G/H family protein [Stenomitos rutilans HA7619-LM2]|jgi:hypothetical protein|nr:type IV pilin-like G/H family protein [Stenomitos rutilans HA7619-LM2]
MTQPNLLERAQQGDPQAIAALMNLTLEPEGVVAKAVLEDQCLHVFLSATRALNAQTLVAFIQRGIQRLDIASIQRVLVYGQRLENDQPDWVETFMLPRSPVAEALEALSHPSSASAGYPETMPIPAPPTPTLLDEWKQRWLSPIRQVQSFLSNALTSSKQRVTQRHDRQKNAETTFGVARSKPAANSYLKLSVLVTLIAFVTGGAVALIANSYTIRDRKTGSQTATIASNSQQSIKSEAERNREQQQATTRKYLETMNQAQKTFYSQNGRFASTLEELERFAAVPIASRSDYIYKLTVPSRTQSQLAAVPKANGLKSYTAAVSIAKTTNQAIATICTSQQAAKVPPLVFQSPEGKVQCPVESAKAP